MRKRVWTDLSNGTPVRYDHCRESASNSSATKIKIKINCINTDTRTIERKEYNGSQWGPATTILQNGM